MTKPTTIRSKRIPATARHCASCGVEFTPARQQAEYCSNRCRSDAFRERAQEGKVASVRRLKSGRMSVVVHMDKDTQLAPGQDVRVG